MDITTLSLVISEGTIFKETIWDIIKDPFIHITYIYTYLYIYLLHTFCHEFGHFLQTTLDFHDQYLQ